MPLKKPTSISLILTLLILSFILTTHSQPTNSDDNEDDQELQQLFSIDDEQETQQTTTDSNEMRRAQRIVVELNNDNTQKIINQNQHVLILGYTPWCPRSADLMPHFAKAANMLSELGSTLVMAKVDAERFPQTASSLAIKGYPTLLLFINGSSHPYTGGFTAEELVIWARKNTGEPVVRLNSVAEAEAFAKKYTMFVIGLFDKFEGSDHEEFVRAATADNEIQFVETNSIAVAEYLYLGSKSTKPFIGLVKSEPERYTSFSESLKMEKILHFLDYNKFPLVITLNELNSVKVYSSPFNLQVYVFAESEEFKSLLQPLQDIAKKFKSQMLFIYVDITEDNLAKPFLTLLGLEDAKKTVVAAFDNKITSKYLLKSEPIPSKIEEFSTGLLHGTVPIYYKSQPIPDNTNASVLVVVGETLDDLVFSSSKNILLEVHTPWCMTCDTTSKQVEKLAKHFKGTENLIFAKFDASANEHPKLQVTDFPTLLFYPASDKSNPVKLSTKSNLKDLAAVIKKNVKGEDQTAKDEL